MSQITDYIYRFTVTTVAMYKLTVADWDASNGVDVVDILRAVQLSLQFTRSILVNNTSQSLSKEQETSIRSQSRMLLSSLTEKMATATWPNGITSYIFLRIVEELAETCGEVSRGYEMVPDRFLSIPVPIEAFEDHWIRRRGNALQGLDLLKFVVQQQGKHKRHHEEWHVVRDSLRFRATLCSNHNLQECCFHTQQPPAMVF